MIGVGEPRLLSKINEEIYSLHHSGGERLIRVDVLGRIKRYHDKINPNSGARESRPRSEIVKEVQDLFRVKKFYLCCDNGSFEVIVEKNRDIEGQMLLPYW